MSTPIARGPTPRPHPHRPFRGKLQALLRGILCVRLTTGALLASLAVAVTLPAQATSLRHQNVVDLIQLSELILVGRVTAIDDGFENGVPYTEVTLQVDEALKGTAGGSYTFRQFGLRAPKAQEDGRTCVAVTPDGWPRFENGEEVLLFLYKKASMTGLRTTVGLLQGKFHRDGGRFVNGIDNEGLFEKVAVSPGLVPPGQQKLLTMKKGPVWGDTFLSFVRTAVQDRWIENRKLRHVQ